MPDLPDAVLDQLVDLIERLYAETEGFSAAPDDQQLWYNRGYANGMVKALRELGQAAALQRLRAVDAADVIAGQQSLPWGKAYLHGVDMGERETYEITEQGAPR